MSKGFTQSGAIARSHATGSYDRVPFSGFRPRLLQVLKVVGLLKDDRRLDGRMTANETVYGWASVIRCSLTGLKSDGTFGADSAEVISAMKRPGANEWLAFCISTHVKTLSNNTRLVMLLSSDARYMDVISRTMKTVFARPTCPTQPWRPWSSKLETDSSSMSRTRHHATERSGNFSTAVGRRSRDKT